MKLLSFLHILLLTAALLTVGCTLQTNDSVSPAQTDSSESSAPTAAEAAPQASEQPPVLEIQDKQLTAVSLNKIYSNGVGPIVALPAEAAAEIIHPVFFELSSAAGEIIPLNEKPPYQITLADGSTYSLFMGTDTATQTQVSCLTCKDSPQTIFLPPADSYAKADAFYNETMTMMELASAPPQNPNDPTLNEEYLREKYAVYCLESTNEEISDYETWKRHEAEKQPERRQLEMDMFHGSRLKYDLLEHLSESQYSSIQVRQDGRSMTIYALDMDTVREVVQAYNTYGIEVRFWQSAGSLELQKKIMQDIEEENFFYDFIYRTEPNGMITILHKNKIPNRLRRWLKDYEYRSYIRLEQLSETNNTAE